MDNLVTISKMIFHIEKIQEYIKDLDYERNDSRSLCF